MKTTRGQNFLYAVLGTGDDRDLLCGSTTSFNGKGIVVVPFVVVVVVRMVSSFTTTWGFVVGRWGGGPPWWRLDFWSSSWGIGIGICFCFFVLWLSTVLVDNGLKDLGGGDNSVRSTMIRTSWGGQSCSAMRNFMNEVLLLLLLLLVVHKDGARGTSFAVDNRLCCRRTNSSCSWACCAWIFAFFFWSWYWSVGLYAWWWWWW